MIRTVNISGKSYNYNTTWSGQILNGHTIALDTETVLIDEEFQWEVPDIVLISVSDGTSHFLLPPCDLYKFLHSHKEKHFVMFNCAFDFWVIDKYLVSQNLNNPLWDIVDNNKLHDSMLLDSLYRLAENDEYPSPRNLGIVSKRFANMDIDKDDPFRLRYGEILGKDFNKVDVGFLDYAIKDTIATYFTHLNLFKKAVELAKISGVSQKTLEKFGPLTESIQVKAAIALYKITNRGIPLDLKYASTLRREIQEEVDYLTKLINTEYPLLFKRHKKTEQLEFTDNGVARISRKVLVEIFTKVAQDITTETGKELKIPKTEKGAVSTSMVQWGDFIDKHDFLTKWDRFTEKSKLLQFFSKLKTDKLHPRYNYFVRTGRTSQQSPNFQQWPQGPMRNIIIPSPGFLLVSVDYSYIELRTLAAVFEDLFGKSVLAEVIRSGKDPHAWTGAMFNNLSYEDFMKRKETDPKFFKKWRQNAKATNFGVPGGLSANALLAYAKNIYGIKDWKFEDAKLLRDNLCYKVYPELGKYLEEDGMYNLCVNLDCSIEDAWTLFHINGDRNFGITQSIRNIVGGKTKKTGEQYNPQYIQAVWNKLQKLNNNVTLYTILEKREPSLEMVKRLFFTQTQTLTGRIRGRVSFTQAKNTPFQALAADGAKLALWRLIKEGYRIINFVHDEINFELPDLGGYVSEDKVEYLLKVMCDEMAIVTGAIPIKGEYLVSSCWKKEGKMRIENGRIYPL